jgi:hypothetical protein
MPGYIHTCASCGAHMQVHERYLGRSLRCTSCRTEFVAAMPEGVAAPAYAPPSPAPEAPAGARPRRLRWLALLVVPVAALLWWLGQEPAGGVGGALFRPQRTAGEIGELATDSPGSVVVAFDQESVAPLVNAGDAPERAILQLVLDAGHGLELAAGTRVRVLERAGRSSRVRILDGPWESRIVWVPSSWVR